MRKNHTMNQNSPDSPPIWDNVPLTVLMDHIVETHHAFVRQELPRLGMLLKAVVDKHGKSHPELRRMYALFSRMSKDLLMHLLKEEENLFPYIAQVEDSVRQKIPVSWPRFGTVGNPIRLLIEDHDHTGDELKAIRRLSNNYTPPSDATEDYAALFDALRAFEHDMHAHIHAENDVLFPRAIAMEEEACAKRTPMAR